MAVQRLLAALLPVAVFTGACERTPTAEKFLEEAALVSEFEIATSEVALARSGRADVKVFATQVIREQKSASDKLMAVAIESGREPVARSLDDERAQRLEQLNALSGPAFDRLYIELQLKGHEDSVLRYAQFANGAEDSALAQFARDRLPTLETRLSHVRGLSVGGSQG